MRLLRATRRRSYVLSHLACSVGSSWSQRSQLLRVCHQCSFGCQTANVPIPLQVQELVAHLDNVREQLVAAEFFPAGSPDVELLTEMAVFGDAGCFLDKASCHSTQLHSCTYDARAAPDPKAV